MRSKGKDRPRFAADEMLGSLAKWLRIIGYDTVYERDRDDDDILKSALSEGRVLLTRDKALASKAGDDGLYIVSDRVDDQVGQVAGRFDLVFDEEMTRCAACNGRLIRITRDEASSLVPPRSLAMTEEFFRCEGCGKAYWKGTHWNTILEKMRLFGIVHERSLE